MAAAFLVTAAISLYRVSPEYLEEVRIRSVGQPCSLG